MKNFNLWFILALIAIFAMTCASQWDITHRNTAQTNTFYTAPTEHDTVKLADILLYTDRDGVMYFDTNKTKHLHGFTGDSIMFYYGYLFDVGEHNELRFEMKYSNNWHYGKETTYFYNLYHKGYLLAPSIVSSNILGGQLYQSASGLDRYRDVDVDTTVKISPKAAFDVAMEESRKILKEVGLEKFIWEYENFKRYTPINDVNFIKKNLTIKKDEKNNYRLAYRIEVMISTITMTAYEYFIDAQTGEVITKQSLVNHLNCTNYTNNCTDATASQVVANVNTRFYGNQDIYTYNCSPTLPISFPVTYKLGQRDRKVNFYYINPPSTDNHICWDNPTNQNDIANAGYFALIKSMDFFQNEFNISFGMGAGLPSSPDTVNSFQLNAVSSGGGNTAGSGVYTTTLPPNNTLTVEALISMGEDDTNGETPNVKIKQVAHEFTHNAIKTRGNYLTGNGGVEEYAIMEFFCDVVGLRVENETIGSPFTGNSNKWKMQLNVVNEFRDFSNPLNSNPVQPKVYNGLNWSATNGHLNSGVPAHWYYLISEGNTSSGIPAIGINKAFNIAKKTLFYEIKNPTLYPQKDFGALRKATLKIAKQIYGDCSVEANAVRKAWDAVGVTGDCELSVQLTTYCPSPSTCDANIVVCGYSGSPTSLKRTWKQKVNGVYQVMSNISGSSATLTCGNEYQIRVDDLASSSECFVIKNFVCKSNNEEIQILPPSPPCPPDLNIEIGANKHCDDKNDINLSVTGGLSPYTYSWSNGSTSQNLSNMPSGTYTVTVSDNCYTSVTQTITINGFPTLNVSGQIQTLCSATDVGAVTLNVSGGKTPYTYHWSNGATSQNLSNLSAGSYAVTVTDANGCTKNLSYYVGVSSVTLQNFSTTPSCIYSNDGVINIGVYGGTAPYTYQWQGNGNSQTVQNPTGLRTGQHCVTVTDANGCVTSACYTVPAASYSYINDLGNCERIYTCNGQTYAKDMLDYANIDYDYDECYSFTPCKLPGGSGLPIYGNKNWYLVNKPGVGMKCKFICSINGMREDVDPDLIAESQEVGPCNNGGTWVEFYCDGEFVEGRCDEYAKIGNPNPISVYPNPFVNKVSIKFMAQSAGITTLKLYNITGQEVWDKSISTQIGENELVVQFDELSSGVYFLHLKNPNGESVYHKLIHQ